MNRTFSRLILILMSSFALASSARAGEPRPGGQEAAATSEVGQEENLLAEPEEPADETKESSPEKAEGKDPLEGADSFGEALSSLKLETIWSGYGDILLHMEDGKPASFSAKHFNPILLARLGENLSAELEMEFEPGNILAEYVIVDFKVSRALTLRVGRFLVPLGQFNEVLHPSFRWNMATRPLMFKEVLPAIWSDTGIQVRGTLVPYPGMTLDYAAYVANGLAGGADYRSKSEVVRSMRTQLNDNNGDKAFGGRVALGLFTDQRYGATHIGLSGYSGAVDPQERDRLSLAAVDASLKLGNLLLRGEACQSFLGANELPLEFNPFERGVYVQATYYVGRFNVAGRWDWAQTRPSSGDPVVHRQVAGSIGYAPTNLWNLRVETAAPLVSGGGLGAPSLEAMVAFSF